MRSLVICVAACLLVSADGVRGESNIEGSSGPIAYLPSGFGGSNILIRTKNVSLPDFDQEQSDSTLDGFDADLDGVRDDFENWVAEEFMGDHNAGKRAAIYSAHSQISSLMSGEIDTTNEAIAYLTSINCMSTEFDDPVLAKDALIDMIFETALRTDARTYQYFSNIDLVNDLIARSEPTIVCP